MDPFVIYGDPYIDLRSTVNKAADNRQFEDPNESIKVHIILFAPTNLG